MIGKVGKIYFISFVSVISSTNPLTQRTCIPQWKVDLLPSCPFFILFCNIFFINFGMTLFKFDVRNEIAYFLLTRIKSSPERFQWFFTMKYFLLDKFRCSGLQLFYTPLLHNRYVWFVSGIKLLSHQVVHQDQLLDPYGDSCDRLKKDEIFNTKDRFVDKIYLCVLSGQIVNKDSRAKEGNISWNIIISKNSFYKKVHHDVSKA